MQMEGTYLWTATESVPRPFRLKIFATILDASYDENQNVFLPSHKLPENKVEMIGTELERIVKKCLEQRSNVNTKKMFMENASKKEELQEILDSVLKMAYPYISEYKKLTQMKRRLTMADSVKFSLIPVLLPMGFEDRTDLVIGVMSDAENKRTSAVKISVWRQKSAAFYQYHLNTFIMKFKTETEIVEMASARPFCTGTITLRAAGAAAMWPRCLGDYVSTGEEYHGAAVFRNSEGRCLYAYKDGSWRAGIGMGSSYGGGIMKSVETHVACPGTIKNWQCRKYVTDSWEPGEITASCSAQCSVQLF